MSLLHASSSGCPTSSRRGRPGRRRGVVAGLCASLVLGAGLTGCSTGTDADAAGPRGTAGAETTAARALRMKTQVTRVLGTMTDRQRDSFAAKAEQLIAGYLSAAYLHERPGSSYKGSFPGFTPGARQLAMRDTGVVSDRGFAGADEVRPRGAVAYLSVVAPEGRPVGATARVWIDLVVTEADRRRRVEVSGRLLLTPGSDSWRIFGYDLALGTAAARGNR